MGQNSTEVSYGFGQFGSTFVKGDGAFVDLTMATAKYYVSAITMVTDVTFQTLESLDGGVRLGMGNTAFVGTEAIAIDIEWGGVAGANTTNESSDVADTTTTADTFPKGITIYGMWDKVELNSGSCIVYVAPRPDYKDRA